MIVGTGCDLTPIERLSAACLRHPALVGRLFTPAEQAAAEARGRQRWERLAGLFAAKESTMKALGCGMRGAAFCEIEVEHEPGGRPRLRLRGEAARHAHRLGAVRWHVSIAHAGGMAFATVVAEDDGGRGDPPAGFD